MLVCPYWWSLKLKELAVRVWWRMPHKRQMRLPVIMPLLQKIMFNEREGNFWQVPSTGVIKNIYMKKKERKKEQAGGKMMEKKNRHKKRGKREGEKKSFFSLSFYIYIYIKNDKKAITAFPSWAAIFHYMVVRLWRQSSIFSCPRLSLRQLWLSTPPCPL